MFETIAILVFLATFAGIIVHWFVFPATSECRGPGGVIRGSVHAFSLLLIEQRSSLLGTLKKLCYLLALLSFLILGVTGFWPVLVRGEHISRYSMMIHATFAPIFALCAAILALTWAGQYRFEKDDCPCVQKLLRRVTRLSLPVPEGPCKWTLVGQKAAFWAVLVLLLPLMLSILLSMYSIFGTSWQRILLDIHRWTALLFSVAAILLTYLTVRIRMAE